ncbi:hypothetical protein FACS1894111_01550 [Clostridia bacterium]|nr:hypothetical protein FACS1894111_01550 [Clostridia bacterium]
MNNEVPGKGKSIASLVLGICALVVPYGGIVLAIVGLVLGASAKKDAATVGQTNGMATAGLVLSIIALAWAVLLVVLCSGTLCALGTIGSMYY